MKTLLKSYNIFTAVFAAVIILTCVCTPIFGLGDLAEYTSTFENVGLYNMSENTANIARSYGIAEKADGAESVYELFLCFLINVNKLFSENVFSIHLLSVIYCIAFICAVYFLQKNVILQKDYLNYAFSALLGIIFLDLGYIAYFNSFYSEALVFVLIFVIAALVLSAINRFSYIKLIAFALAAVLLASTRFASAVVVLTLAAAFAVLALKHEKRWAITAVSAIVAASSVVFMFNAPVPARDYKLYSHIYTDIADDSDTALSELGAEPMLNIADMEGFMEGTTYGDVVKYYASNPKIFFEKLKTAANNSYFLILEFAEYREAGADYGLREHLPLKIWNLLKKRVLPQGIWVILVFIAAYLVMAVREYARYSKEENLLLAGRAVFAAVLPVGALAELAGTVITTGEILISKNMFVFGIYFDMMVLTAVIWAAATLIARQEAIKSKYGVKQ